MLTPQIDFLEMVSYLMSVHWDHVKILPQRETVLSVFESGSYIQQVFLLSFESLKILYISEQLDNHCLISN